MIWLSSKYISRRLQYRPYSTTSPTPQLEFALIVSLVNRETILDVLIAEDTGGWCGLSALYAQRRE